MENEFLDKMEDNMALQVWSERMQLEKGDSLTEGQLFYGNYGDLPYLLDIKVDEHLFRALAQFLNSAFSCFTFGKVDLVPTMEEYTTLLRCPRIQKGESKCIPWKSLRDLILAHLDMKKKVDVFALSIYGLIIFPKALGHVDEVVTDLFDRLDKRVTPILKVDKVSYRVFSESYSPLKELVAMLRRDDITEERWITILQNLQDEDIKWRAPWLVPNEILYRCRNFDWVPLLGIWGAVRYAPLLVLRQYRSRQFIPAMQGLAQCEFSYKGDNYKKKIREMFNAWNQTYRMKRFAVGLMTTPEYYG
ncbi:hypothetical protein Golob_024599 [Gossypium lobatum]|uniref:DUF7745 domain-containing protein n=2 Tax=Gossypium lobatum TaxID=34289 RepID=A0A7J8NG91_9ROSI|nr:hypothetical protein [Gossypium lobatum]